MGKLVARDSKANKPFKPQIYQSKRRGQGRNLYDSHNNKKENYQNRYRSNSGDRELSLADKADVGQGMDRIVGEKTLRGNTLITLQKIVPHLRKKEE